MSGAGSCISSKSELAISEVIEALAECGHILLCASRYVQQYFVFFAICQLGTSEGHTGTN